LVANYYFSIKKMKTAKIKEKDEILLDSDLEDKINIYISCLVYNKYNRVKKYLFYLYNVLSWNLNIFNNKTNN